MGKIIKPNPLNNTPHKTEWTCAAKIAEWINTIVKAKALTFGEAEVETTTEGERKRVDITLMDSPMSEKTLCVIEMKRPYFDPFEEKELKEPARKKAVHRKAKYFVTSNFKQLIWFNTEKVNKNLPEEEQIHGKYFLSEIEDLDLINKSKYKKRIISGLERFLVDLCEVYTGKKPEPRLSIDELLIFRLHEKIKRLSSFYRSIIEEKVNTNITFLRNLQNWFTEQNWSFTRKESDFDKAAHQAAYLLVNKILFYNLLQAKRPEELDPLNIPEDLTKGGLLQSQLQGFFDYVLNHIDYETIYRTDFIDQQAFPEHIEVVREIKELIRLLKRYDFSEIGFDIIGRIFERLIPSQERHNLGQYFTHPNIVDLILRFCLNYEKDKVFDPACGAGTFLVRAYQHKKLMNQRLTHQEILKTLWGTDIAKFPAHLATINLAINDLKTDENYPQILQEDFFNLRLGGREEFTEESRKKQLENLSKKEITISYPKIVDCIVGNPPYTRHEEISAIAGEDYLDEIIRKALYKICGDGKKKIAEITGRAGIHAYFFVHGTKFLQNGGKFGFIVSNSWLDANWGKGLQEFFLKNYKIIAIIDSKVERWFEDADVNTCIVILEKCLGKERNKNIVRFAYLKKPIRHFIPPAKDMWEKQKERLDKVKALIDTILFHSEIYENEELRIFPKPQKELWVEGFSSEKEEYVGAKWGKYLRAPEVFYKILKKGEEKLISLKKVAAFAGYIHDNNISSKFPKTKIILSSQITNTITVRETDANVVMKGVKTSGNSRLIPDIVVPRTYSDKFLAIRNPDDILFKRFYKIILKERKYADEICLALNSTLQVLFWEYIGIPAGLGALNVYKDDFEKILIPKPQALKRVKNLSENLAQREIKSIFEELGFNLCSQQGCNNKEHPYENIHAEEVSFEKIKSDRRELDKIIMGEILGLNETEQLEVYKAVVDMVKSRIVKAKSFGKRKKTKSGIDINRMVKAIMHKIGKNTLGKFYKEKILCHEPLSTKKLPKQSGKIKLEQNLYEYRLYIGKKYVVCASELEARYLRVWLEAGMDSIKIPKDKKYLMTVVPELENLKRQISSVINLDLDLIFDRKTRAKIEHQLWKAILK